jgi:FkbM family methyltransferase
MNGVISIGAHWGEEYEGWVSLGCENFLFFEPVSFNFKKLRKILPKSDKIRLFNLALGNLRGTKKMFVEKSHQGKSCSLLEPFLHLQQYPDIEFKYSEQVQVDKLDNIGYDRDLYDHLHIDTQGYEMEVLKGAEHSLSFIKTIQVEVYKKELFKGCIMFDDITKFLEDHGFEFVSVFWRGISWGDAQYRRK